MKRAICGAAFAVGMLSVPVTTWLRADLRAQAGASGDAIGACVAADGTLRMAQSCAADERHLSLQSAAAAPRQDDAIASLHERIAALERMVQDLEGAAARGELGNRVVEPFVVKNADGVPIFSVSKGSDRDAPVDVMVKNNKNAVMAGVLAADDGVRFHVNSVTPAVSAWFGVDGGYAGLRLSEGGFPRVDLGRSEKDGNHRLLFFAADETPAAGLGQSAAGSGIAFVSERGAMRVRMMIQETGGLVQVLNTDDTGLVAVSAAAHGGGVMQLSSNGGTPMVEAIAGAGGFGVVAAGPAGRPTGGGLLGVPGSYIMGNK
jgi:hypothetical protein